MFFQVGLTDPLNIDGFTFLFLCLLKLRREIKFIANYPLFVYSSTVTNPSEETAEAIFFPTACHVRLRLVQCSPSCDQIEIGLSKIIRLLSPLDIHMGFISFIRCAFDSERGMTCFKLILF